MISNKSKAHRFYTNDGVFDLFIYGNALFIHHGIYSPEKLKSALQELGYGYSTPEGFTFTTRHIPSRNNLRVMLELNGCLPTLKEHIDFNRLGWAYKARYALLCLSHLLAGIMLLAAFMTVYSDVCKRHPEFARCQRW